MPIGLNLTKTKAIIFSKNTNGHQLLAAIEGPSFRIKSEIIEIVDDFKILGVISDSKLSWKNHIDSLVWKLSTNVGVIYKIRNSLCYKWLMTVYNSFFLPVINYCLIWGGAPPTALKRIDILQKRVLKLIMHVLRHTESSLVCARTKVLTVSEIHELQTLIFIYKHEYRLLPQSLYSMFKYCRDIIDHNTRSRDNFYLENVRLSSTVRSHIYQGPMHWNKLQPALHESKTLAVFKRKIKMEIKSRKSGIQENENITEPQYLTAAVLSLWL